MSEIQTITTKSSIAPGEKMIKPRDTTKVTIFRNAYFEADTTLVVHSELAAKLIAAKKAKKG